MRWKDFYYEGKNYDLSHLRSRTFRFVRPAKDGLATEVYDVDVLFTSHCFTRKPRQGEVYDPSLSYPDDYETRLFDHRRYEMSKQLPEIVQNLPSGKPRHNRNRGNYFSVTMLPERGQKIEYDVFFKVRRPSKGRLEMIVETAFVRDPDYGSKRPEGKPVRFWIILHNTRHGLMIRT